MRGLFSGDNADWFDRQGGEFELEKDALETDSIILYPGRFYVLKYMSKKKEVTNTRPVILSLGLSQKDPESFLCIDLCVIPRQIRLRFLEMYFRLFESEILKSVKKVSGIKDADKQQQITQVSYQNIFKVKDFQILKPAIKRYKIKNTNKIYSILFNDMFKVAGDFTDKDFFINGSVVDVQKDFLDKIKLIKK